MSPLVGTSSTTGKNILDVLVSQGRLKPGEATFLMKKYRSQDDLAEALLHHRVIGEENLVKGFALLYDLPFVHLKGRNIDEGVLRIIPEPVARTYRIVAFERTGQRVKIAVARPYQLRQSIIGPIHQLEKTRQLKIDLAVTTEADIEFALQGYNRRRSEAELLAGPTPYPYVNLLHRVINRASLLKFPEEIARKYEMVVFEAPSRDHIRVAALNPSDPKTRNMLEFIRTRNNIKLDVFVTDRKSLDYGLSLYQQTPGGTPLFGFLTPRILRRPSKLAPESLGRTVGQATQPLGSVESQDKRLVKQDEASPAPAAEDSEAESLKLLEEIRRELVIKKTQTSVPYLEGGDILTPKVLPKSEQPTIEELEEPNLDKILKTSVTNVAELYSIVKLGIIPKTVAAMIALGVGLRASDIHLEPTEDHLRLRYRVDGVLHEYLYLPMSLHPSVSSRIKILAELKIDEQRIPQDGRLKVIAGGHEVDIRVSTFPTVFGEKVVMRLLDKSSGIISLENLGMQGEGFKQTLEAIKKPYGVILATGPTGSGKTTTLYAILAKVASPKVNVLTLEDPVEYEIPGINQAQIKPKIGFTFADGLRSVLRQDPNIIMVGEIRDAETASLVTHAALTGHLVLTTLHTNDAASALPRLLNMGVEPFLITSAIQAIIAQRLVRRLCQVCAKPETLAGDLTQAIETEMAEVKDWPTIKQSAKFGFKKAVGCDQCRAGYIGRMGIFEVITRSGSIEEAALRRASAGEIGKLARQAGMVTMKQDGIIKAAQGLTTLAEVFKTTSQ